MADQFSPAKRSRIMRAVKSTDTAPEMIVRRLVHALGYRYRLHSAELPGKPDLVLPRHRKVILVHGCFWHRHACRSGRSMPASRVEYWQQKFERNVKRDCANLRKIRRLGWRVLVIWECQTRPARRAALVGRVERFLDEPGKR